MIVLEILPNAGTFFVPAQYLDVLLVIRGHKCYSLITTMILTSAGAFFVPAQYPDVLLVLRRHKRYSLLTTMTLTSLKRSIDTLNRAAVTVKKAEHSIIIITVSI